MSLGRCRMYWWKKMNLEGTCLFIYTSCHNFSSFNVDYQMDIVYTEQPSAPTNKQTAGRVDEAIFSMILKRSVSRPTEPPNIPSGRPKNITASCSSLHHRGINSTQGSSRYFSN